MYENSAQSLGLRTSAPPREMPTLPREISALEELIDGLYATTGHLVEQLGPITVAMPERNSGEVAAPSSVCSPVTNQIRRLQGRVKDIQRMLAQCRDTLEV